MITLLTGENSFEISRALHEIEATFKGEAEHIDGSELSLAQLPDLLMGQSLFSEKRLIIIKELSENKTIWPVFEDWLPRVSDDIKLVLVEPKPDKRLRTYKALQKVATVQEFPAWTESDATTAEQWVVSEARRLGLALDKKSAHHLVERVGPRQWELYHALEKLSVLPEVTAAIIDEVVEANPTENVFALFETALRGNGKKVHEMIEVLALTEDAYKVFGLLSSQALQLAALAYADQPSQTVASDIGAHPFVLSKLARQAQKRGRVGAREIVELFAEADSTLKTVSVDPWIVVEQTLLKIANI